MKTIHKYPFDVLGSGEVLVEVRQGFEIQEYREKVVSLNQTQACFWAIVDDTAPLIPLRVVAIESGEDATAVEGMKRLGTLRNANGTFHLFV